MLIAFPVELKAMFKKFPYAVVGLSLGMILIFFTWQSNDSVYQRKAIDYYFSSDLYKIELPTYLDFAQKSGKTLNIGKQLNRMALYWQARGDKEFQIYLDAGEWIKQDSVHYWAWLESHRYYKNLLMLDVSDKYGFKSENFSFKNGIMSLFLHGSLEHLIGNIIFLLLIGLFVEARIGSLLTLVMFCSCGLGSVLVYYFSVVPNLFSLVGASGAIAGFMGMFSVLYQFERLNFFVNIFFYSTIVRLPAIVFLPIWMLWEMMQMAMYPESQVAYAAHMGGLAIGAIIGVICRRCRPIVETIDIVEMSNNIFIQKFNHAKFLMMQLNYPEAQKILLALHKEHPENHAVLYCLFKIVQLNPVSDICRDVVKKIIDLKYLDVEERQIQNNVKYFARKNF